jgi:hypothetical protein
MTTGGAIVQVNECERVGPGEERTKMVGGGGVWGVEHPEERLAQQLLKYQVGFCSIWLQ